MSDDEMKALVAEARRHAEALINGTETGDADLLHDMAYALEDAQETIAAFIIGGAAHPADDVYQTSIAHPAEETVTTVEALDALPVGSVVQMTGTRAPFYRHSEGWFSTWTEGKPVYDYIRAEHLPARVLYRPVPEGSETA